MAGRDPEASAAGDEEASSLDSFNVQRVLVCRSYYSHNQREHIACNCAGPLNLTPNWLVHKEFPFRTDRFPYDAALAASSVSLSTSRITAFSTGTVKGSPTKGVP